MRYRLHIIFALALLPLVTPGSAYTTPQKPLVKRSSQSAPLLASAKLRRSPPLPPLSIQKADFKKGGINNVGIWHGLVKGSGEVELWLQFLRGDLIEERRYIGRVILVAHSSTFQFRTTLPSQPGWKWRIEARSKRASTLS